MISNTRVFYATCTWFDAAEPPDGFSHLPEAFVKAKTLWDNDPQVNQDAIVDLLSPFVAALFIPANIDGWKELFIGNSGDKLIEVEAYEINVAGISFKRDSIPLCKAEAKFKVEVTDNFATTDLDEWQDEHGQFYDAAIFCWNIPRDDETEDLDFTFGSHQGVECILFDDSDGEYRGDRSKVNCTMNSLAYSYDQSNINPKEDVMSKVAGLEVVFSVNGKSVTVGSELLATIVSFIDDNESNSNVFEQFAKSTSFEVRENVSLKDNLNEATVAALAADQVEEVLINLIRSDAAKYLTHENVVSFIAKSTKLASCVSDSIGKFEDQDPEKLCALLAGSADPIVRKNLAGNYDTPKKIVKSLLKDEDVDVAAAAKNTLD